MKKGFKKLFSGLMGLFIVGIFFGVALQAHAAITTVTVVSPNGGQARSGTNNITWTTNAATGNVDIYYCLGSCSIGDFHFISGSVANSGGGSFSWDTTTAGGDSSGYKIFVTKEGSFLEGDLSDTVFTVDNTGPTVNAWNNELWSGTLEHWTATATDTGVIASYLWYQISWTGVSFWSTGSLWTTMHADSDGTYTIGLLVTDTLGNTGADTMTLTRDATAPVISLNGSSPVTIEVWTTYSDAWATVLDAREGDISGNLSAVSNVNTGVVGSYAVTYNADDTLGNAATEVVRVVNVTDTQAPIVAAMGTWITNSTFTQTWTVTDTGVIASYSWSQISWTGTIDFWTPTALGTTITASQEGTYTIQLLATDASWNTWVNTLTLIWDISAPEVNVWADMITNHALTITGNVTWDIAWVASYLWLNEDVWLWTLTTPGGDSNANLNVSNASSNWTYTIGLLVTDNAGNTGYDTMELTWDTVKPTVVSAVGTPDPSGIWTVNVVVTFTETWAWMYTSIPPRVSLSAGGTWYAVTPSGAAGHTNGYIDATPTIWEGTIDVTWLTDGTGTFIVTWAEDYALNIMTDELNAGTLEIDQAWPTFTIDNGTAVWPVQTDTINITASDSNGVLSQAYGFSADVTCDGGDTYAYSFTNGDDFTITWDHTDYLCIKGVDVLNNISYTGWFLLNTDNTAPTAPVVLTWVTTPWTGITPTIGILTTEASGHIHVYSGGVFFVNITPINSGADTIPLGTFEEWVHNNISISFFDYAGNESTTTAVSSFTIDLTKPVAYITPLSPNPTNDNTPTFTWTATDNLTNISWVEYSIDSGSWTWAIWTWTYTFTVDTLADGSHLVEVRAIDEVNNTTTSYASDTFLIDTQSPTVTFNIPVDANTTMSIAGQAINTGLSSVSQVEYFIDVIWTDDDGTDLVVAASGTTTKNFNGSIDVSALSNWPHILYVHAKNAANGRWTFTYNSFNKTAVWDTIDPILTMIGTINSSYNEADVPATWTWSANENGTVRINWVSTAYTSWNEISVPLWTGVWAHTYTVRVTDAAGNYDEESVSYQVMSTPPDSTVSDITSLYVASITDTWAIMYWTSDVAPDNQQYRIKLNNWTYWSYVSLGSPQSLTGLTAGKTYIAEVKLTKWSNITTDTVSFTTAKAASGISVNSLERIVTSPVAWWGYISGYHFRFYLTINSLTENLIKFKLADRSNGASTMAASTNSLVRVSEGGTNDYSTGVTLTGTAYTTISSDISALDHDVTLWWRQVYLDLFYKIPTGAWGVYTTTYGISTEENFR